MSEVLPTVRSSADSAPFFEAWSRGELLIRRCVDCAGAQPPEARTCVRCGSTALEPAPASGRAQLVSWAVVHQAPTAALAASVPYTVAVVELEEGPWLFARLVEVDQAELVSGVALRVRFVRTGGDQGDDGADGSSVGDSVPVFALGQAAAGG